MKRREFLEAATAAGSLLPLAAACGLPYTPSASAGDPAEIATPRAGETIRGEMRYRKLGRTGEEVSVIGLGGHHESN